MAKTSIEWRNIDFLKGFEGYYQVSNQGDVKSLERTVPHSDGSIQPVRERILKQQKNYKGYMVVKLSKNHKSISITVHRLVLLAFVPNPENKPTGNHKDCNKLNNFVENLVWNTYKENMCHAIKNGLQNWNHSFKPIRIVELKKEFISIKDCVIWLLENGYKANRGHIGSVARGERKTHCGLTFEFLQTNKLDGKEYLEFPKED